MLESVEVPEPSTPKPLSDVTNYTDETEAILSPLSKFFARSSNLKTTFIQEYLACLNTASKEQLMELKGIGKRRADHIVALREASPIQLV
ncbi:kinesin-like protein KIN-10C [Papaver somniferum]|uniref:kinesin-like protein KIN-10C n=1 Tax=Papaver somniferum TaxID=3469 RepID=UPI000E6F7505|nr:kinesin-like protein KIN-10C [Papaver somniferum]